MAKMKSTIFSVIRGSVAGQTFLATRNHPIVSRVRSVPVNPNTVAQVQIRNALAAGASIWTGLTDQQKIDWANYAVGISWEGPVDTIRPTGRQMFIAQYVLTQYFINQGSAEILTHDSDAPDTSGLLTVGDLTVGDLAAPGTGFGIALGNGNKEAIVVYGITSLEQSAGRFYWNGPYQPTTFEEAAVPDATTGLIEFTGLNAGGVYFIYLRAIADIGGRRISRPIRMRAVARVTV